MNKEKVTAISLFKYGIIAPVLYENIEGQNEYFRKVAKKTYDVPYIGRKKFKWETFKSWLRKYRKEGYSGLKPKTRSDKGSYKKLNNTVTTETKNIIDNNPHIKTASFVYKTLIKKGIISPEDFTEQTLRKYIHVNKLFDSKKIKARKKYEMSHINQLWVADFSELRIYTGNKKKRTKKVYLCAIIDDFSRVIVGYNFSFNENIVSLVKAFKDAIKRFGKPQKFYCDNGSSFVSKAFSEINAKLNIALIHSKPYDPSSRGKIERFFHTMKMSFSPALYNITITLAELNKHFSIWLEDEYHKKLHKSISDTPMNRYLDDIKNTNIDKIPDNMIDRLFMVPDNRKVNHDSTISWHKSLYEVDPKYIGSRIELRYPADNPEILFLYESDDTIIKLKKVDAKLNANPPHISLSYLKLLNQEVK